MSDPQWARVLALYESACGLAPDAARALLESSREDPAVVREVRVMLEAERQAESHPSAAQEEYAGVTIGRYEVISRIGSGSSGEVYSGRDRELGRRVALKFMSPEYAGLGSAAQRFIREAQAASALNHPNIVTVHEVVTWNSSPVIVMELVEGAALRRLCGAPLPLAQALTIGRQIMEALAFAHDIGIVHRDLKPENAMVRPDGYVKLLDLGLARRTMTDSGRPNVSSSAGLPVGTLRYMSPEQCRGDSATPASDVFAAGIVLSEMITGHHPFDAKTPLDTAHAISWSEAPALGDWVAGVPAWIEHLVARMLEKEASSRPSAVEAVRILADEGASGANLGKARLPRLTRKRAARFKYGITAAAALILLVAGAYLVTSFMLRHQKRENVDQAALREVVRRIIIEGPRQLSQAPNRTGLRSQLIKDAEAALDALSRDGANDVDLQTDLARAYLSIGLAKGPYNATGSEGDPAGASPYVKKSVDLYSALAKIKPADVEVRRGQLEALSTWVHLQYRLNQVNEGQKAAREMQAQVDTMSSDLHDKTEANWYLSMAYTELGLILASADRTAEALAAHRQAASLIGQGIPAEWMKDPDRLDHLARVRRELAITAWMTEGYTPEVQATAKDAVDVVSACGEANCRMRHAQAEGTLGEIEWASGKRDQGIATLRRSLAQFESLQQEDPQNAVVQSAGAQIRSYLSLMLAGGPHSAEAVTLAEKNIRQAGGADSGLHRGRERLMVHQITLGAALLGAGRLDDAERELRQTLERNRDWNANADLVWSAVHLLAETLGMQGKYEEAVNAAKGELKRGIQDTMYSDRVRVALAARDYASAVSHWKGSGPSDRAEAVRALDSSQGLDDRYGVLAGALLVCPPKAAEVAVLRKKLL